MMGAAVTAILLGGQAFADGGATFRLNGETTVHAESPVGSYDRTFHPTLVATVSGPDSDVAIEVKTDGHACTLHGTRANDAVTLAPGQKCPQSISGTGITADLDGTLTSGSASTAPHALGLHTVWNVRGSVRVGPLAIPVTGTVITDVRGTDS
jgi:hypothetical protein